MGLGSAAATAAAAYVAATVDSSLLAAALTPACAPLLDPDFFTDPTTPASPYLAGVHLAARSLPDASRDVLTEELTGVSAAPAPAAAAAAGADADAAPARPGPPRRPRSLQQKVSRPIHQDAQRRLREQLAGRKPDAAQHLSESGWLGTVWLEALPRGTTELSRQAYLIALSIMLHLPLAAFEGRTCLCGEPLTAATGCDHVGLCNRFERTGSHNILGDAFDSVLRSVPGHVVIVGQGGSAPALGTVLEPRWVAGVRQLEEATVYPDRYVTGIRSDPPAIRRVVDFFGPNVRAARYCERAAAATVPLTAANLGHRWKKAHYERAGLLAPGDLLMPVVVELHGGLHEDVKAQLEEWARAAGEGDEGRAQRILQVWRMTMAMGAVRARVGKVLGAIGKLDERDRRDAPVAEGRLGVGGRRGIDGVCRVRSELERELGILPRRERAGLFGRGGRRGGAGQWQ